MLYLGLLLGLAGVWGHNWIGRCPMERIDDRHTFSRRIAIVNCSGLSTPLPSAQAFSSIDVPFILDLSRTGLQFVPGELADLQLLSGLYLDGNPLVCDCNLRRLIQQQNLSLALRGSCQRPHRRAIENLRLDDFDCGALLIAEPEQTSVENGSLVHLSCKAINATIMTTTLWWIHAETRVAVQGGEADNFTFVANYDESPYAFRCTGSGFGSTQRDSALVSNVVTVLVKNPHCNSPSCGNCTIAFTSAHGRLLGNSADWDETTRRLTFRALQAKGAYVLSSDAYEFRVLGVGIRAIKRRGDQDRATSSRVIVVASITGRIVVRFGGGDDIYPGSVQLAFARSSQTRRRALTRNRVYATWYDVDLTQAKPNGNVFLSLFDENSKSRATIEISVERRNGGEFVAFHVTVLDNPDGRSITPIDRRHVVLKSLLTGPVDIRLLFSKPEFVGMDNWVSEWIPDTQLRWSESTLGNWTSLSRFSVIEVGVAKRHQTIQSAVNAAETGSIILVFPGQYDGLTVNKSLQILSNDGPYQTIIISLMIIASDVSLEGFTFYASLHQRGLEIDDHRVQISNCVFDGPYYRLGLNNSAGIAFSTEAKSLRISNTLFTSWHEAIDLTGRSQNIVITNNVFESNDRALGVDSAANLTITNNVFRMNQFALDVSDERGSSHNVVIRRNVFAHNRYALRRLLQSQKDGYRIDARENFWSEANASVASTYWSEGDVYPGPDTEQGFLVEPALTSLPDATPFPSVQQLTTRVECDGRWIGRRLIVRRGALRYAVDMAPEGATLRLQSGVYREEVLVIRKNLSLVGNSNRTEFHGRFVVEATGSVSIRGIKMFTSSGAAITLKGKRGHFTLTDMFLFGSDDVAIRVEAEAFDSSLSLCGVQLYGWATGLKTVAGGGNVDVRHSVFKNCRVGVNASLFSYLNFSGNRVEYCRHALALQNYERGEFEMSGNAFYEVAVTLSSRLLGAMNIKSAAGNYWFPESAIEAVIYNADFSVNHRATTDLKYELVLSKADSPPENSGYCIDRTISLSFYSVDFETLGDAVSTARSWDTILITEGDYDSEGKITISQTLRLVGKNRPIVRSQLNVQRSNCLVADLVLRRSFANESGPLLTVGHNASHVTLQDLDVSAYWGSAPAFSIKQSTGTAIVSSKFVGADVAISLATGGKVSIEGNTFVDCAVSVDVVKVRSLVLHGNQFGDDTRLVFKLPSEKYTHSIKQNNFGHGARLEVRSPSQKGRLLRAERNFWADHVYGLRKFEGVELQPFLPWSVDVKEMAKKAKSCVMTSGVDSLDDCKVLPVLPSKFSYPNTLVVSPGTSVNLFAEADTGGQVAVYQWFTDGNAMKGEVNQTLRITNVTNASEANYAYRVETEAGGVTSKSISLVVRSCSSNALAFTDLLEDVVVDEGSSANLVCPVCPEIATDAVVKWYRDERLVKTSFSVRKWFRSRVVQANEGKYHCEVAMSNQTQGTAIVSNSMFLAVESSPSFTSPLLEIEVDVNSSPGDPVGNPLIAFDGDLEQNVRYVILGGSGRSFFSIDSQSGQLFIVTQVGNVFRQSSLLNLTVAAIDNGPWKKNATVLIFLTITRQISLQSHSPTEIRVAEGDNFVVSVQASNGRRHVSYQLETHSDVFSIDSTGHLRNRYSFDYESDPHFFNVTLIAEDDEGFRTTAFAIVVVTDVNEHLPKFARTSYKWSVPELTAKGTVVGSVSAADADGGTLYGTITYEFVASPAFFVINPLNGDVSVSQSLDYETVKSFQMDVVARDGGGWRDTATIQILVTDVNDNRPRFLDTLIVVEIIENTFPLAPNGSSNRGVTIATVKAIDDDQDDDVVYESVKVPEDLFLVSRDGQVIMRQSLDFEMVPRHEILISAFDGVWRSRQPALVIVKVQNANDNPPRFEKRSYSAKVTENVVPKEPLAVLAVTDDDGNLTDFQFILHNDSAPARVTEQGEVFLYRPLDYESRQIVELNVFVTDGTFTSNLPATVTIVVENVNDNRPSFDPTFYSAAISSNLSAFELEITVIATDNDLDGVKSQNEAGLVNSGAEEISGSGSGYFDEGNFGDVVRYEIRESGTLFSVGVDPDSGFGVVTNVVPIIWLTYRSQNLTIDAYDGGGLRSASPALATIARKEPVEFSFELSEYFVEVEENTETPLLRVRIINRLSGTVSTDKSLVYGLEGKQSSLFVIDPSVGEIRGSGFDYEQGITLFNLTLTASVKSSRVATSRLIVALLDQNDNSPIFRPSRYDASIAESAHVGTMILKLEAVDGDLSPEFNSLTYSILNETSSPFIVDPRTGWISLVKSLDYETQKDYSIVVSAKDNGLRNATALVVINVTDVNDVPPCPSRSSYVFAVNWTVSADDVLLRLRIDDSDGYTENLRVYFVSPSQDFVINDRFEVRLANFSGPPRVEVLRVLATDGNLSCPFEAEIQAIFEEINLFPPEFRKLNHYTEIAENVSPGSWTYRLRTFDRDNPTKLLVTYEITRGNQSIFSIQTDNLTSNGILSTKRELDAEADDLEFHLEVIAYGPAGLRSERPATIVIKLTDENEFPPIVTPPRAVAVPENYIGDLEFRIFATDPDRDSDGSGTSFSIVPTHEVVEINRVTGQVYLKRSFDYETDPKAFSVFVVASDEGGLKSLPSRLLISVEDENDHSPVFDSFIYRVNVSEDVVNGTAILNVTATDGDVSPPFGSSSLRYYIIESSEVLPVSVDALSGTVRLRRRLDYESFTNFTFTVAATDGGNRTGITVVDVRVIDVHDTPSCPQERLLKATVTENSVPPYPLMTIKMRTSSDSSGQIVFKTSPVIHVRSDGALFLKEPLDYELGRKVHLSVSVLDGNVACPLQTTVVLRLRDQNDNRPYFKREKLEFDVDEGSRHLDLTTLIAYDDDAGKFGRIVRYAVEPNDRLIVVTPKGTVHVLKSFDYEKREKTITRSVYALDGGRLRSRRPLELVLHIVNVNDNAPAFNQTRFEVFVPEKIISSNPILRLNAVDPDGDIDTLSFSLAHVDSFFKLTADGQLFVIRELDFNNRSRHVLLADVSDGVHTSQIRAQIVINVVDVNDPPHFVKSSYDGRVLENVPKGSLKIAVSATDPDVGSNGKLTFEIVELDVPFVVEVADDAAFITNSRSLDYERDPCRFALTLLARDGGGMTSAKPARIEIEMVDVNEFIPEFSLLRYDFELNENLQRNWQMSASDGDRSPTCSSNANLTFALVYPSQQFFLSDSGVLANSKIFDFESGIWLWNLTVAVRDAGGRFGTAEILVRLLDVNEHSPSFLKTTYEYSIEENQSNMSIPVGRIKANDLDGGFKFGKVTDYYVVPLTDVPPPFTLSNDGSIFATKLLDFENDSKYYEFDVAAVDGGGLVSPRPASVRITIVNVNDNRPYFPRHNYSVYVVENRLPMLPLSSVRAMDADGEKLSYNLLNYSNLFEVTSKGDVYLVEPLDYETKSIYEIIINVSDGKFDAPALLTIFVQNANEFSPERYVVSLKENSIASPDWLRLNVSSEGEVAAAYDIVEKGDVPFEIVDENKIVNRRPFDYETDPKMFVFTVTARDSSGSNGTVLIIVNLEDENDNDPNFTASSYSGSLYENVEPGFVVVVVATANDADLSENYSRISYRLVDDSVPFTINRLTGEILSSETFDYESGDTLWSFAVEAVDGGGRVATARVAISIKEVNEFAPVFTTPSLSREIFEDVPIGTTILNATATDADAGPSVMRYEIVNVSSDSETNSFLVTERGEVVVAKSLDYERTPDPISFEIIVIDQGGRVGKPASVVVEVLNVNDNAPKFSVSTIQLEIAENASPDSLNPVFLLSVTDADGDSVHYHAEGNAGSSFAVTESGAVLLLRSLDYEKETNFLLSISAFDGVFSSPVNASVSIAVRGVNDNSPRFLTTSYNVSIAETEPAGTLNVLLFIADDDRPEKSDAFNHSAISRVEVVEFESLFKVAHSETSRKAILTNRRAFDYESDEHFFSVKVYAYDEGGLESIVPVTVNVLVLDKNEFHPEFDQLLYETAIKENSFPAPATGFPDAALLRVRAVDADGDDKIIYKLLIEHEKIELDRDGFLILKKTLDYETESVIRLEVIASDGEKDSRPANVTIFVENIDDEPPRFLGRRRYEATVVENTLPSLPLLTFNVINPDGDDDDVLTFTASRGRVPFTINSKGELFLTRKVDYEVSQSFLFRVRVSNGRRHSRRLAAVVVDVVGVNDNLPVFDPTSYFASVEENLPGETTVVSLTATDADVDNQAQKFEITYAIATNDETSPLPFRIETRTGVLVTTRPLDFEGDPTEYDMLVHAYDSDGNRSATPARVRVRAIDVNDHAPIFSNEIYETMVKENTMDMRLVVSANDADGSEQFSTVRYEMEAEDGPFLLNKTSGKIYMERSLDYETSPAVFRLKVVAIDGGGNLATANVTIGVEDTNDVKPVLTQPIFNLTVSESTPIGAIVHQFVAVDGDASASFSTVRYFLKSDEKRSAFVVNETTGELIVAMELDYEEGPKERRFVIEARDSANLTSSAHLYIYVTDVRDVAPCPLLRRYHVKVPENSSLTASLLKIEIVETDATLPSNVSFILHDDESVFEIVGGELFLTKSLDFESVQSYRFNVTVSDEDLTCDEPSSFFIDVQNVNDNRPKFYASLPVINVSENADFNVVIGTVEAYDEDEGRFGEIAEYRVSPSDAPFHISDSGEIKAIRSFDAESDDAVYRFAARACDGGGLCADTDITVRIIDVNDFVPEFSSTSYEAKIGRLTESGSSVINVTAFDKDRDEPFNAVTYRIEDSSDVSVPFAVDNRGHVITTAKMPNEAIVFAFNLVATDGGGAESEPVEIRISIVRQRDLPPRFSSPSLELSVREDAQPGFQLHWFRIAAPIATFPAIVRSDDVPSAFHLTTEGRLSLIARIDYEKQTKYEFVIRAERRGLVSYQTVIVNVEDVNESPEFLQSFYLSSVNEGKPRGTLRLRVDVSDVDSGSNGLLSLSTQSDLIDVLSFDRETGIGIVSNAAMMDYESTRQFTANLIATDGGGLTSQTLIWIVVVNVNEFSPLFATSTLTITTVEEEMPRTKLFQLEATDDDDGVYGEIGNYAMNSLVPVPFIVTPTGEIFNARRLDYDKNDRVFVFSVRARDNGGIWTTPSDEVAVKIVVTNINDNSPIPGVRDKEEEDETHVPVPERRVFVEWDRLPSDLPLLVLQAFDDDDDDSIYFYIQDDVDLPFAIPTPTSGRMILNQTLNDRPGTVYNFTVLVRDRPASIKEAHSFEWRVVVFVIDTNAPPYFEDPASEEVRLRFSDFIEVGPNGFFTVPSARDGDFPGSPSDTIVSYAVDNDRFNISSSGVVSLTNRTFETLPFRINIAVTATDGGGLASVRPYRLSVRIWFENDHAPVLHTSALVLSESWNALNRSFATLEASDLDDGPSGRIAFASPNATIFNVTENGDVFLLIPLDYDRGDRLLTFAVTLSDFGEPARSTDGTISVRILNENDNAPSLILPQNRFLYQVAGAKFKFAAAANYTDNDGTLGWTHVVNVTLSPQSGPVSPFTGTNCQSGSLSPASNLCMDFTAFLMSSRNVPSSRSSGRWRIVSFTGKEGEQIDVKANTITNTRWQRFTLQCWAKIDDGEGSLFGLVVDDSYFLYAVEVRREKNDRYLAFRYRIRARERYGEVNLGTLRFLRLDDNGWHHLAIVANRANLIFYVDGNKITADRTPSRLVSLSFSSTRVFRIGGGLGSEGGAFSGSLWGLSVSQAHVADQVRISCTLNCGEGLALPVTLPGVSVHYFHMGLTISADSTTAIEAALRQVIFTRPYRPILREGDPRTISIVANDGDHFVSRAVTLAPPNSNFYPPELSISKKPSILTKRNESAVVVPVVRFLDEDKSLSLYSVVARLESDRCARSTYDVLIALRQCEIASGIDLLPRDLEWTRGLAQGQRDGGRHWFIFDRRSKTIPAEVLPSEFGLRFTFAFWIKVVREGVVFDKRIPGDSSPLLSVFVNQRFVGLTVAVGRRKVTYNWVVLFRSERRHVAIVCQSSLVHLYVDGELIQPGWQLPGRITISSEKSKVSLGGMHSEAETRRNLEGIVGELSGVALVPEIAVSQAKLQCLLRCMEKLSVDSAGLPSSVRVTQRGGISLRIDAQVFPQTFETVLTKILYSILHPFPLEGLRRIELTVENGEFILEESAQVRIPQFRQRNVTMRADEITKNVSNAERIRQFEPLNDVNFVDDRLARTIDLVRVEMKKLPRFIVPFTGTVHECEIARRVENRNIFCVNDDSMFHVLSPSLVDADLLESMSNFDGIIHLRNSPPVRVDSVATRRLLDGKLPPTTTSIAFTTYVSVSREKTVGYLFACVLESQIHFGLEVNAREGTINFVYTAKGRQTRAVFKAMIDDGRWHHLVLNLRRRRALLYVDGKEIRSKLQKYVNENTMVMSGSLVAGFEMSSQCTIYLGSPGSLPYSRRFTGRLWGFSILPGKIFNRVQMDCLRFLPSENQCIESIDLPSDTRLTNQLKASGVSVSSLRFDLTLAGLADETFYANVLRRIRYTNWAAEVHPDFATREVIVYATDHGGRFQSNRLSILLNFSD